MSGKLTTHVLDTARGKPAAGIRIELWRMLPGGGRELLGHTITNADGRANDPLLDNRAFRPGRYELRFLMGDYWRAGGVELTEPPFLDIIPVAFGIADAEAHYHVPLLVSPWAYSTYRGS